MCRRAFHYSAGVAAETGFEIERARLVRPLPLADGFAAVEGHLAPLARPTMAFCACELRSPAPFTEAGFTEFNRAYVTTLERWRIFGTSAGPTAKARPRMRSARGFRSHTPPLLTAG
jgi:hypothetical protein